MNVTYMNYQNFGSGTQTVLETVFVDGSQAAQKNFTFTGPSGGPDTLTVNVGSGSHLIEANAYSINEGATVVGFPIDQTVTCSSPPPQQTIAGDIYDSPAELRPQPRCRAGRSARPARRPYRHSQIRCRRPGVAAGTYTMSATAPSGYQFVKLWGNGDDRIATYVCNRVRDRAAGRRRRRDLLRRERATTATGVPFRHEGQLPLALQRQWQLRLVGAGEDRDVPEFIDHGTPGDGGRSQGLARRHADGGL